VEDPAIAVSFENAQKQPLMITSSDVAGEETGTFQPGDEAVLSVHHEMVFAPGRIFASVSVSRRRREALDRRPQFASLIVLGSKDSGGLVDLPHEVSLESHDSVLEGRGGV